MNQPVFPPYTPEPLAALRARWPVAVAPVITHDVMLAKLAAKAPMDPGHVFDFASGLRMIASRENHAGVTVLHVSFSVMGRHDRFPSFTCFYREVLRAVEDFADLIGGTTPDSHEVTDCAVHFWFQSCPAGAIKK